MTMFVTVVLWTAAVVASVDSAITCLDANGKPVDWFIVYKLPEDHDSQVLQVQEGYGQMYMDVNNPSLKLSNVWLNDTNQAIAYTLQQIYSNKDAKDVAYVMYNDGPADSSAQTETYGHTKGDLAFDDTSGFWLVHSTPHFPRNTSFSYNWPDTARRYGQSFICVTYGYDQFEDIGKQLMYNYPLVYDSNLPPSVVQKTPSLVAAVEEKHVTSPPWNRSVSLTSLAGQTFISFAKFTTFQNDLYSSWLAPYFESDLYVETWQNGPNKLNSSCVAGQYAVNNVLTLNLIGGESFKETKDHSKWAVTIQAGSTWTCIGDINRQCHQMVRGGGTICFDNKDVHTIFRNAITGIQKCPQETTCYQDIPAAHKTPRRGNGNY